MKQKTPIETRIPAKPLRTMKEDAVVAKNIYEQAVLKVPSWPKQNISSTIILLKPWNSFVFHHEGEKQGPWLNYSPPTQFRLICMQDVQLKHSFQPRQRQQTNLPAEQRPL